MDQDVRKHRAENDPFLSRVQQAPPRNEAFRNHDQKPLIRSSRQEPRGADDQKINEDLHHHLRPPPDPGQADRREGQSDKGLRTLNRRHPHQAQLEDHRVIPDPTYQLSHMHALSFHLNAPCSQTYDGSPCPQSTPSLPGYWAGRGRSRGASICSAG